MRWKGHGQSQNVEDRRRMRPAVAVGGIGMLLIVLIGALLGIDPRLINRLVGQAQVGGDAGAGQAQQVELTPEQVRTREFVSTVLRFTEDIWGELFRRAGKEYKQPQMVLFAQQVQTACGAAPAAVGPFYCPLDETVYLDPTFFDELEQKFGGSKAEFSQAYVIAHEVGHHVQNQLGYTRLVEQNRRALPQEEGNKWSVRLELQADYLAGVWAHHGQQRFQFIEPGDIEAAIQSANAIGDDRIQKQTTGFVSPENFTHGSSKQRVRWFTLGLKAGDLSRLAEVFETPYDGL
jgi:predicted metalloprotease